MVHVVPGGDYYLAVRGGELCRGMIGERAFRDDRGEDHVLDRGYFMVDMAVGNGRGYRESVRAGTLLYIIYFVRGIRGYGGDVSGLFMVVGTDGGDCFGERVFV